MDRTYSSSHVVPARSGVREESVGSQTDGCAFSRNIASSSILQTQNIRHEPSGALCSSDRLRRTSLGLALTLRPHFKDSKAFAAFASVSGRDVQSRDSRRRGGSRRLLNRAWGIGGSSGDDLCQAVRDRLVSGALFPVPRKAWGGHGTEKVCSVCDVIISSTEIEFQVAGPTTLWVHLVCYDIWRYESGTFRGLARASSA